MRAAVPSIFRRALQRSPWVFHVGTSGCNNCDIEIADCLTPRFDVERFGIRLVGSPRHADVLLLSGPVSRECREPLQRVVLEMPQPRAIVLVGTCPCSMGVYRDAYSVAGPADKVIREVDPDAKLVYVPGCPPKPETIILGIVKLLEAL
jgi:membrane-bound hydrogenase subunit mbhJ